MKTKPVAVLYARYSPRPEPKDSDKPLSKQDEWKKTRAAEDRDKNSCDKQIEYGREYCARMGYDLREENIFRDDALRAYPRTPAVFNVTMAKRRCKKAR